MGRWVFISEWGPELRGANTGAYLVQKKKKKRFDFAVAGVFLRRARRAVEEQRAALSKGDDGSGVCFCLTGSLDKAQRRSKAVNPAAEGLAKTLEISSRVEAYRPLGPMASRYQLPAKAGKWLYRAETVKQFKLLCSLILKNIIIGQVQGQLV